MKTLSTSAALARISEPGAEQAWATLVERHGPDVWRLIASRQWDTHVAEDAYQEFWLHLPQAAKRFTPDPDDGERKAQAWMLAVAYRTAIDVHRRRRPAQAMISEPVTTEHDMEEHDERQHQLARVRSALDQLPEGYRQPVLLHLVGGLSHEDLATELRCTVNNARVKVHRGLTKLRGLLGVDAAQLPEKSLAGMLVPPFLLAPPPAPALSAAVAAPPLPAGAFGVAGKATIFTAIAKAPVLAAVVAAVAATTVTVAAVALHAPAKPPVASQEVPMPIRRPLAAAVIITAVAGTVAAGAVLDDFERDATLMDSVSGQHADLTLVPAPSGIGSGKALSIAWPKDHKTFVDCFYTKLIDAPAFTQDGSAVATFKVWTEAFSGAAKLSIRFVDANLETFQWGTDLPNPGQAGWRIVSFPLIPAESKGHWGPPGKSDGVIDFPMRLNGYAIQFTGPDAPAGSLLIDDVTVAPATAPTTTTP